ncbi:Antho-RFamide neuropeptides type 2 [Amphibalanus amphitrite]|uniref:Antho-RFamide neuropeptides type 2 n=1 Tax=Amphibalanus amphitrite TaxID=1232801 RepID=A0A6A4W1N1_AMPAM|nr:Antho-RFamide neuropeptides type 2 [Amphibalanus amphitrite]
MAAGPPPTSAAAPGAEAPGAPGTWSAADEEPSMDQSQYSSVSGADPTSQWPTDGSVAATEQEQYASGLEGSQGYPTEEQPPPGYGEQSMFAQQPEYGEGQEMYGQDGQEMYGEEAQQMYGEEAQQMYGEEGQQMYGQEGQEMYGQEGQMYAEDGQQMYDQQGQMYGQEGQMYGQEGQEMYGQEGQMYGQEGQEMYGQEGQEMYGQGEEMYGQEGQEMYGQEGQEMYGQEDETADGGGQSPYGADEPDQEMYVGPDGIYPVARPDRPDATSLDVSSLRTADLSSLRTSDVSTVRSSDLSALASSGAAAPNEPTFDSTTTAYRTAPGDPGDPALAAGLLQGAPAAVGSHGELRQYVSQLLDESRERLSQLSMPASSPSTVYGSASGGSLSRSGAADATFATAASPGSSTADVGDGGAEAAGGTSGVYSEDPSQSAAAAAGAAVSDPYTQRYDEVMQKLSEVQQRRDELMRSYSNMADELRGSAAELAAAARSSGSLRPRPPPSLSHGAVQGSAPHELSTILEQTSRTTGQEGSADPAGVTADSGAARQPDVTSTGSVLSRTGVRSDPELSPGLGTGGRAQDDTLSQFSNLASSQEYFSQESPRPGSAAAASGRPASVGSASEVSLRSSALERALEASREAIRSVSGTGGGGAQPRSQSGQSSPDVGKIISKLGMKSRSGPLTDPHSAASSSSSGSVSAQRQPSRAGRASGDELRRKVLSKQAHQSSSSGGSSSSGSSSSSSASSVASGSPGGSPSAGSSGMLAPLDLSAAPPPAVDSSLDTDKFEAGVAAGGVQSTPMKRSGPAPEGGPVAGLSGAVSMRPKDMTMSPTSDED